MLSNLDWVANTNRRARFLWVSVFFFSFFIIGLRSYRDYNTSWDELISRDNGMITLRYVGEKFAPEFIKQDKAFDKYKIPLEQYIDRDYGIAFETPVSLLERLFHLESQRDIFLFRHLCTFLVCFGGSIAIFQLAERRFADWRVGLLAALWLILSPRLFADFFYNDKDAVFMALFAVAMNTGVRFLLLPTLNRACWHALACAITVDVRIMGIILPIVTAVVLLLRVVRAEVRWRKVLLLLPIYAGLTWGLIVLFWPYLWSAPWKNFQQAFENMSKFRWIGGVLYMGTVYPAANLPWHYIPVWISISTPLLYLGSFLLGAGMIFYRFIQRRWRLWRGDDEWQDLLFLSLFVGPIAAVIFLNSTLYDGWRQVYFLYPAFLLVAVRGWVGIWHWRPIATHRFWQLGVAAVTVYAMVVTTVQIIRTHPIQNAYFNLLAGNDIRKRFEIDYWGLSNLESLRYIVKYDDRPHIRVAVGSITPLERAVMMLKEPDRSRIELVAMNANPDYIVTNYRAHPEDYNYTNEVFRSEVSGVVVNSVFKNGW